MEYQWIYFFTFLSGVIIESIRLLGGIKEWKKICFAFIVGLIGFFPGKKEVTYALSFHMGEFFFWYSLVYAYILRDKILPLINETKILLYTIVFWFLVISIYQNKINPLFIFFAIVPTIVTIIVNITSGTISKHIKIFLYVWYLCLIVAITMSHFTFQTYEFFYIRGYYEPFAPINVAINGMAAFYLLIHLWHLFEFIPIPGKRQSIKSRMKQWREYVEMMHQRYIDKDTAPFVTLLIIVSSSGAYILNNIFRLFPDGTFISLLLLFLPTMVFWNARNK